MFKNIVVAIDGSDQAQRALEIACDLAKHYDGKIHLVHTPQVETVALAVGAGAFEAQPPIDQIIAAGQSVMDAAAQSATDMGCSPAGQTIGKSTAAGDSIRAAGKAGADLIVAGRRGLGGIGSMLLGSTSLKIAHDAPCAVLTVK